MSQDRVLENLSTESGSEKPSTTQFSRRTFLDGAIALAGTAAAGIAASPVTAFAAAAPANGSALDPALFPKGRSIDSSSKDAVATTESGKIKGYISRGIYTFKGIPYGDDTGGANRFVVAQKVKPWTGVRSCMAYGRTCPQPFRTGWNENENAWMFHWSDGVPGEDCLRLNVWTPSINDNAKRAVMFWIHGGGYTAGSAEEQPGYDGENLAKRGDVVVVSINHRLNVLGFLNLEKYGDTFKHSGNVSQLDIVAALEWVKTNIAGFGGDPNQVTIFGQSGGGGKVAYLMGMPSAQGLFHRAIIESGSKPLNAPASLSVEFSDLVLEELQIPAARFADVQQVPYDKLLAAGNRAVARQRAAMAPANPNALRGSGAPVGWQPYVDGEVIPGPAYYPAAPEMSRSVPVLIGSTLNEFITSVDHPEWDALTWDELHDRVEKALPGKGDEAIKIYRTGSPGATPFDLWSQMNATTAMRRNAVAIAAQKAAQGTPAYNYQFRWQTPVLDGRARAFHCSEIAFAFNNPDVARTLTGGGDDARALAARVSDAWISFAKTGNPNHPGLPKWEPVSANRNAVMWFDNECELKINPDADELRITA
jgi:para-nitrobenzyl esterase